MSGNAVCPHTPELLAPSGDPECLRAAVSNGADAVYFGLEDFNARRRATNFTVAGLSDVLGFLHDHNVRGYVTFNTLVFSDELERASDFIARIAEAGADAVIVQDLGLLSLIRRIAPTLPVHASTQMTQTHPAGIEVLREMGVQRVILARELSIAEIAAVARGTGVELEVFVHGAICISYSGQCLASESLWGRSANRGVCGQACRLPYQLVVDGRPRDPGDQLYLLSAKDLASWDLVPQLIAAGVRGFKIEGRLKSAHYVAAATSVYREAIDAAVAGREFRLGRERESELAQSFSRGFSHGFLEGNRHQGLVDGRFPKSRGLDVGRVVGKTEQGVLVELTRGSHAAEQWPIRPGDGVVFDQGHPEQDEQGGRVYSVEPIESPRRHGGTAPACLELRFGRGDVNLAAVAVGGKVWKTDDPAVRRRLESSYGRVQVARRVPLHVRASMSPQGRLIIQIADDHGHNAAVESSEPLAEAIRHPLTAGLVREQFSRLGDTPFELASVELLDSGQAVDSLPRMAPKSVLNQLRRDATQMLLAQRAAGSHHRIAEPEALKVIRGEISSRKAGKADSQSSVAPAMCVLVRTLQQLDAVLAWNAAANGRLAGAYVDFAVLDGYTRAVSMCKAAHLPVGLAAPRICKPDEEAAVRHLADLAPDFMLVPNLAALSILRREYPGLPLIGDYSLNVANEITADLLRGLGLSRVTASHDLNIGQLAALRLRSPGLPLEVVIHQHMPMFHMAHCVTAARLSAGEDCGSCGGPCRDHAIHLRDRKDIDHPVLPDVTGRSTVFNARVQSAVELGPMLRDLGATHWRVELLHETPDHARRLVETYSGWINGTVTAEEAVRRMKACNPAGVARGTLDSA